MIIVLHFSTSIRRFHHAPDATKPSTTIRSTPNPKNDAIVIPTWIDPLPKEAFDEI